MPTPCFRKVGEGCFGTGEKSTANQTYDNADALCQGKRIAQFIHTSSVALHCLVDVIFFEQAHQLRIDMIVLCLQI